MSTATNARRRAWTWFLVTATALLALLVWLSVVVVGLERDELRARRASADEQNLRLALWRMDSWLAPRLAREALRPIGDFRAFASPQDAWTRGFSKIAADEVLVPSPLLGESPVRKFPKATNATSPRRVVAAPIRLRMRNVGWRHCDRAW